jgi:hypothetical protein
VRVQIGPVSATSVTAWVDFARTSLEEVVGQPGAEGVWLPDETVATFVHYLDEWEKAATGVDEMRWAAEVPAEEAEYLLHAFFRIASNLANRAEDRGYTLAPPGSEDFYRALVTSFLAALDAEGHGSQEFSEHLRSFWPGLEDNR